MSKIMGQRIHTKRIELGLSMEELGKFVGVSRQTICNWEKGEVENIARDHIKAMADLFHCEKSWLMNMEDAPEVTLTYEAPDKEPIKVKVTGDPIIGKSAETLNREQAKRVALYAAVLNVKPENYDIAIKLLESLS